MPKDINERFQQFYETLYSSQSTVTMQTFFGKCNLPTLSEMDRKELGSEITVKDISETVKSLKSGKTPGPDGLSNEFYKTFNNIISPQLQCMYTQAYKEQTYHRLWKSQLSH